MTATAITAPGETMIDTKDLEVWAGFLLDHSLQGITADDRVMIKGEAVCWPLMVILERRVIEAGGVPDVYVVPPNNERGRKWRARVARSSFPPRPSGTRSAIRA
jgi:hypothetical protein